MMRKTRFFLFLFCSWTLFSAGNNTVISNDTSLQNMPIYQLKVDSNLDFATLSSPCTQWEIKKNSKVLQFDSSGTLQLSQVQIEAGYCNCKHCSRAARTLSQNDSAKVLLKDCTQLHVITTIKDHHLAPPWFNDSVYSGIRINLNQLIFKSNKAKLEKKSTGEVKYLALFLKQHPSVKIKIVGHVNAPKSKNTAEHQKLSEARANTVLKYLVTNGISPNRLKSEGRGNLEMLFPKTDDPKEMKLNRRVEIIVL